MSTDELTEKISRFPNSPGVYIFKDSSSRPLYVGKAVQLRSRVRSYFGKSSDARVFHQLLVSKVADAECIVTESEAEALILENNLIKKHRPVYNIRLKDDKTYVSIKVTLTEEWPRVMVVRRFRNDGNLYFGPYGSAGAVREMLRLVKTVFPLRTCTNGFFASRKRPCIEYEIGRCSAPCVDLVSREDYQEDVNEVVLFLRGKNKELARSIEGKMAVAAEARNYELAARYRDQLRAIEKVFQSQKAQQWTLGDIDVFAVARESKLVVVQEVLLRDGRIVNSQCHSYTTAMSEKEVLASFLSQYYLAERFIPPEVLLSEDFPDHVLVEEWLSERKGERVRLHVPQRGDKAKVVELARKNCLNAFEVTRNQEEKLQSLLESLAEKLEVARLPRRIECYDISNFQGSLAVGSLVRFEDGKPLKNRYRKFRIQTVVGADDFRCMHEVLDRRLRRGIDNGDLPDLIIVDGGKGQLSVATKLLDELGLAETIDVISIAKERRHRKTTERIFVPGRRDPLPLAQDTPESLYIQRIRDEAHRFAVKYHRELRKRHTLRTGLEGIPGIGKKRREALLDHFGTLKNIRAANEDELAEVVGKKLAAVVAQALKQAEG